VNLRILDQAPALIRRAGIDAKCDWVNATWRDFTGRALQEEAGHGWMEGIHPEDVERSMQTYLDAFAERQPFEMEYRLRREDGTYRWLLDHGIPFDDEHEAFTGAISYCFDITDRKAMEQSLFERTYELEVANAELERARHSLEQLALFDNLTGLPNRHNFTIQYEREAARQKRTGATLALLIIDVDHFKAVNDRHGHLAGDACLKALGLRLSQLVRPTDVVSRFGGEEFLVLLPEADAAGALAVAGRLCAAVRAEAVPTGACALAITVSIGGATSQAARPLAFERLLECADAALYRAKSAGRDRVVMSDQAEPARQAA
jgi:diguanylate cyclase (GGDEF)-like protein/PAS domain S-box-containing protein